MAAILGQSIEASGGALALPGALRDNNRQAILAGDWDLPSFRDCPIDASR
jgi:hypothetical protein